MGKKRIIGFENSNSSIKARMADRYLHYPNTIRKVKTRSSIALKKLTLYEIGGEIYQVGFEDGYGSGGKNESRYYSEQFKIESAIALYQLCNHGDDLHIVTGLPANLAEREDIVEKLKQTLVGDYEVKVGPQKKKFKVASVSVVSQPVGTLWSILFDYTDLSLRDGNALNEDFLIVDIGFGTTDICALSASSGIDMERTLTLDIAMSDYINRLMRTIELTIPETRLTQTSITPYRIDQMLLNNDILKLPTGTFNIADIKKDVQEDIVNDLKMRMDNLGYSFDRYYKIIFTGGGASTLYNAINNVFANPRIILADDPCLANVNGFYVMAQQTYGG